MVANMVTAPANMATPSINLRSIGDLTKEDDQMIIILHSDQFRNAHVMLGRSNKGVSFFVHFVLLLIVICNYYEQGNNCNIIFILYRPMEPGDGQLVS
jgi:hypothetical protein